MKDAIEVLEFMLEKKRDELEFQESVNLRAKWSDYDRGYLECLRIEHDKIVALIDHIRNEQSFSKRCWPMERHNRLN